MKNLKTWQKWTFGGVGALAVAAFAAYRWKRCERCKQSVHRTLFSAKSSGKVDFTSVFGDEHTDACRECVELAAMEAIKNPFKLDLGDVMALQVAAQRAGLDMDVSGDGGEDAKQKNAASGYRMMRL